MPKLKVDRIVSFSSEDLNHSANNVLLSDTTKKWKCQAGGEKAANLVFQLEEASIISGIDIGNENSAYVEVLVARSGSNKDFVVLLVMSSFMTPLEARQSTNINKVRMFGYNDLQSPERDQKWDRVKIVCTQPFNRHAQFGLSFVTLHSPGNESQSNTGQLGNFSLRPTSPDNLSAGSLFARRKELGNESPLSAAVAIRKASTNLSTNGSPKIKEKIKIIKQTPTKTPNQKPTTSSDSGKKRNRNELLYDDDDEAPNAKIDQLIEQKNKETEEKQTKEKAEKHKKEAKLKKEEKVKKPKNDNRDTPSSSKNQEASTSKGTLDTGKRKLQEEQESNKKIKTNRTKPFNKLLEGVTIVISGIQNPERATIRTNALDMGAKYKGDWDPACTHLICAFTNTPKFKQVRGKGKIVNRLWVSDCHTQRKRLPWRRYALDSLDQNKPESEDEICEETSNTPDVELLYMRDGDKSSDSESNDLQITSSKLQVYNLDTDEEDYEALIIKNKDAFIPLLEFFDGKVFYVDQYLEDDEKQLLTRYITAYKGLLLEEPSDIVDFVITSSGYMDVLKGLCPNAEMVSSNWIWDCHNCQKLVSHQPYNL